MKTNRLYGALVAIVLGALAFSGQSLAAAFGVSPPWIVNDNLKPDSNFVYVIDLSTNEPTQDMVVTAKIAGDSEIQKWVTVKGADNLVMPIGVQSVPMYVEVNVPKGAKLGNYSGNITVTAAPKNLSKGNITIALGGNIVVKLKVIKHDVLDFWVRSIGVDPIVEGQPITLSVDIRNLGNIPILNLDTRVQVLDYKTEKKIASAIGGTLNRPIYPLTLETAKIQVPVANLAQGEYWVKVDAIKGGKSVYQNKLYLKVQPPLNNGLVQTAVQVVTAGEAIKSATPADVTTSVSVVPLGTLADVTTSVEVIQLGTLADVTTSVEVVKSAAPAEGQNAQLATTVTVRAPILNTMLMLVIGLMLVIVGLSYKIYTILNGKKSDERHHR